MKREVWVERILTGISAVVGITWLVGAFYAGLGFLWLVMKAPEFSAIVIAAAMVSAAIHFRKPDTTYNLQMGHPDTERVIAAISDMAAQLKK